MSVSSVELLQLHLERDLGLPKLTLRRWLTERLSHGAAEAKRWSVQAQLLARRQRSYTLAEIRLLLELARAPYRGFSGINPAVRDRLKESVDDRRDEIVERVENQLLRHERRAA